MEFTSLTDDRSRRLCEEIVEEMEFLYDIDPTKGCELLNQSMSGRDWRDKSNGGTNEFAWLLFHETARDWASRIANPHPYTDGPEYTEYLNREIEADRRSRERGDMQLYFFPRDRQWDEKDKRKDKGVGKE